MQDSDADALEDAGLHARPTASAQPEGEEDIAPKVRVAHTSPELLTLTREPNLVPGLHSLVGSTGSKGCCLADVQSRSDQDSWLQEAKPRKAPSKRSSKKSAASARKYLAQRVLSPAFNEMKRQQPQALTFFKVGPALQHPMTTCAFWDTAQ